jgi:diacylglycerol kinase family enzyme
VENVTGWLLVNPRSGGGASVDELCAAAAARGVETHVLAPGDDAAGLARAAEADVLGAAAGDGTLASVAGAALERGLPFVCVPSGTRNHFARDLGLDRDDPVGALDAFGGEARLVDVGRANGRLFLNNVSIGAYAVLVHQGWRRVFDELRLRRRYTVDGERVRTRVLLVGNNAYSLTGVRERLDEGRLHVYTPHGETRVAPAVVVDARVRTLRAAIDGEPVTLRTPVECAVEPGALRVLLPRRPGA